MGHVPRSSPRDPLEEQMVFGINSALESMIEMGETLDVPGLGPDTRIQFENLTATFYEPPLRIAASANGAIEQSYVFDAYILAEGLTRQCFSGLQPPGRLCWQICTCLSDALNLAVSHQPSMLETIPCPAKGRLVAMSLVDRLNGVLVGCGIGQLQPSPAVDENGDYDGLEWHPEMRGFAINAECRNIICEYLTRAEILSPNPGDEDSQPFNVM